MIGSGERVAILGPNGAGKTTLALHLNGIHRPTDGAIRIGRVPVAGGTLPEVPRRVGMVFQDSNDQLFMPTVNDDIAFGPANLGLRGAALQERVDEALAAVNASYTADRPPSPSQQRGAAPGCDRHGSCHAPRYPRAGRARRRIGPLREARDDVNPLRSGNDHLVITHDLPLALELCDRTVIMCDGRIVRDGATTELLSDDRTPKRYRLEMPYAFRSVRPSPTGHHTGSSEMSGDSGIGMGVGIHQK